MSSPSQSLLKIMNGLDSRSNYVCTTGSFQDLNLLSESNWRDQRECRDVFHRCEFASFSPKRLVLISVKGTFYAGGTGLMFLSGVIDVVSKVVRGPART